MLSPQISTLTQNDEVNAFIKKLVLWTCFLLLKNVIPAMKQKLTNSFLNHMGGDVVLLSCDVV
jgi:hypothetical protein